MRLPQHRTLVVVARGIERRTDGGVVAVVSLPASAGSDVPVAGEVAGVYRPERRLRPESLTVRMLVPDPSSPWALPAQVADLADSPAFRKRATRIMERNALAIIDGVTELGELGLIPDVRAELRVSPAVPLFKLYLINRTEAFFGYYPVQEHTVRLDGEPTPIWDLMGKDTILFHHSADSDPDSMASQYLQQSQMWFDSVWDSVARELHR